MRRLTKKTKKMVKEFSSITHDDYFNKTNKAVVKYERMLKKYLNPHTYIQKRRYKLRLLFQNYLPKNLPF